MNTINPNMNLPKVDLGVVVPPQDIIKPEVYSDRKASESFNKITTDIYQSQQKSFEKKKRTPIGVLMAIGVIALGFLTAKLGHLKIKVKK